MFQKINKTREYLKEILKKPASSRTRLKYSDFRFFSQFVKPVWKLGVISLFLTVITSGLGSLLPLSGKVLIDFIVMKEGFQKVEKFLISMNLEHLIPSVRNSLESINMVILAILVIGLSIGLIGIIQRFLTFRFQQELTFNLQTTLFDHLLRFPLSFFKTKQTGYLMSRVSDDVNAFQSLFTYSISHLISRTLYLFFGTAIIFMLNTKLALILIVIIPFYAFSNSFFARRLRNISLDEMETTAQVSRDIQEAITGVEVVKAHTAEDREVQKVSGKIRAVVHARIKSTVISLMSNYSVRGFQLITTLLIMWFGVNEILKGKMTIGDFVAFTSYMFYFLSSINTLSMVHISLQPIFASMERLMEMFRIVPEVREIGRKDLIKPVKVKGEIKFENVSFSYEEGRHTLKNISFTARPGEVIALVGPSGAGKTTLINLLLCFHIPQSGSIYLDGYNLKELSLKWLRQQIGIVSQDVFLFNDTIEKNIKYSAPHATKEEVISAAKRANIHDEIEIFQDKYETEVGERGLKLSAGQRQRISIARAFLKDPPILIFDEPASALDTKTERLIKNSLISLAGQKTTFIIAHRLSMIDIAHKILVLENGKILKTCTYEELREKEGFYTKLLKQDLKES